MQLLAGQGEPGLLGLRRLGGSLDRGVRSERRVVPCGGCSRCNRCANRRWCGRGMYGGRWRKRGLNRRWCGRCLHRGGRYDRGRRSRRWGGLHGGSGRGGRGGSRLGNWCLHDGGRGLLGAGHDPLASHTRSIDRAIGDHIGATERRSRVARGGRSRVRRGRHLRGRLPSGFARNRSRAGRRQCDTHFCLDTRSDRGCRYRCRQALVADQPRRKGLVEVGGLAG